VVVLGLTVTDTLPLPDPDAPPTFNHAALLAACHVHPVPAMTVTATGNVSPVAADVLAVGEIEKAHEVDPGWVTLNGVPPIITVPFRDAVPVCAATATVMAPLPVPELPAVTVSQPALLVAVHTHVLPVVNATLTDSPVRGEVLLGGVIE
jgi:hypothetical protein